MFSGGIEERQSGHDPGLGVSCIEAVASWCQAVQGSVPLTGALRQVCNAFGGELAAVARVNHENKGSRIDRVRIVAFDRRANFINEIEGFNVSSAEAVCSKYLAVAKLGSIWHAHVMDFINTPRLWAPLNQRRLVETVVIPLEHHVNSSDFLEIHFPAEIHASTLDKLGLVGETIAKAWKTRSMGLLSRNFMRDGHSAKSGAGKSQKNIDVLAMDNPCKLSRAEYRVCLLLSSGLKKAALLEELSIGTATLRTHLRNIYAKTDTASQAELLQKLLVPAARRGTHRSEVTSRVA
ncbi:helix-turn-helix transcriptional regulator [Marimonas arenosa]|uniref:HTH luxR-type domain-containing protein n=1 Tax=Marimonas arenosa TaxID=1795305 RepID=A0AAE4B3Y8_9RHOB|nr:hypothetical protein [Marimonas arenosa]MDQ2089692.1 hypothetical protein [Marimonas arenosa]